jgi:hypothetical protein
MSNTAPPTRIPRPLSVTLVTALIWVGAVISIGSGVWLIVQAGDTGLLAEFDGNVGAIRAEGIVQVLVGVAAVFVARGIGRGSEFARFLVSLVMIVRIVGDIFLVAQYGDRFLWLPIFWALWSLLVLFLLWNSRASRFFDPQ